MTPQTISLEVQKGMGVQKNSFGTPKTPKNWLFGLQKMRKMIFFKKPDFWDLTAHWGWFPQWPFWPGQCQTSWFNSLNPNLALDPCAYLKHCHEYEHLVIWNWMLLWIVFFEFLRQFNVLSWLVNFEFHFIFILVRSSVGRERVKADDIQILSHLKMTFVCVEHYDD